MAITLVASSEEAGLMNTTDGDLTVTKPAGTIDDDFMVALVHANGTGAITAPAGWIEKDQYDNVANANPLATFYKFASTEPASFDFGGTEPTGNGGVVIQSYRNVNQVQPFDVVYVRATHAIETTTDTTPTPPAITTLHDGSMVVTGVHVYTTANTIITLPASYVGLSTGQFSSTFGQGVAMASLIKAIAGLESPGDWSLNQTPIVVVSTTFALIDAAISIINISNVAFLPTTGWNNINFDGLTIPPDSILFRDSGSHDGAANASVLTDTTQAWTVDEWVDFKLRNTSDGSEAIITANTATTATGTLAGGTDDDWDIGDNYEIVVDIDTGDQMNYEKKPIYVANELVEPEAFDDAAWTKDFVTIPSTNNLAPDGTLTADEIDDSDAGQFGQCWQGVAVGAPINTYTATLFVKKDAIGRATRFARLEMIFSGNAGQEINTVKFDTNTGEIDTSFAVSGRASCISYDDDWWKVQLTADSGDVLDDTVIVYIRPSDGASAGWTSSATATGSIIAWGAALFQHPAGVPYRSESGILGFSEQVEVNEKGVPTITSPGGAELSFNYKIRDITDSKVSATSLAIITI